jgi:hypothetical protein
MFYICSTVSPMVMNRRRKSNKAESIRILVIMPVLKIWALSDTLTTQTCIKMKNARPSVAEKVQRKGEGKHKSPVFKED